MSFISKAVKIILLTFLISSSLAHAKHPFTIEVSLKKPNHNLLINGQNDYVTFFPSSGLHTGLKIVYKYFFFKYGYRLPGTMIYNPFDVNTSFYYDYRLGITSPRFTVELYAQRYSGFSMGSESLNGGCLDCSDRNSLSTLNYMVQSYFSFSKDLNLKHLISGATGKTKDGISVVLHTFANKYRIQDNQAFIIGDQIPILPSLENIYRLKYYQFGPGLGVGFIKTFGVHYIGAYGSAGVGIQYNKVYSTNGSVNTDTMMAVNYNFKLVIGSHRDGVNYGIRAGSIFNQYKVDETITTNSLNYEGRLYLSYTF